MKLIYIVERFISKRMYDSYFVDYFTQRGFTVELWSLGALQNFTLPEVIKNDRVEQMIFKTRRSLISSLQQLDPKNTRIIAFFPYSLKNLFIYRLISKKRIPYYLIANDIHPRTVTAKQGQYKTFFRRLQKLNWMKIQTILFNKIPPNVFGVRSADKIVWGGKKSELQLSLRGKTTQNVRSHVVDYDRYKAVKNQLESAHTRPYIIFIEDDPFGSPDLFYHKIKVPSAREKYYQALSQLFDSLEKTFNMPVVIALHPTQNDLNISKILGNRECYKNKTAELVKDCSLVVLFSSFSVAFAVLFERPTLFLTVDELEAIPERAHDIQSMAQSLGKTPLNIDHPYSINNDLLLFNRDLYAQYKENFIKQAGTREDSFQAILADEFLTSGQKL